MAGLSQPTRLHLPQADSVDIWCFDLDASGADSADLMRWLGDDEQARAARYRRDVDRRRYVAGRGLVRAILARYAADVTLDGTAVEPGLLRITYATYGKPVLAFPPTSPPLHFNLAHSDNIALCAVAARPVGVDVEIIRPLPELDALIARYFAPAEQRALRVLDEAARLTAFYRIWTRKEAWLKLGGEGLTRDPAQLAVSHDVPARLLWGADLPHPVNAWSLVDLTPPSWPDSGAGIAREAVAALAVQGSRPNIAWRAARDLWASG